MYKYKDVYYGNPQKLLPYNDVIQVAELYESGLSMVEISKAMDFSLNKILKILHEVGAEIRHANKIDDSQKAEIIRLKTENPDYTMAKISRLTGVSQNGVYATLRKEKLVDARKQGYKKSFKEIEEAEFEKIIAERRIKKRRLDQPVMITCSDGRTYCDITIPLMQAWEYGNILMGRSVQK